MIDILNNPIALECLVQEYPWKNDTLRFYGKLFLLCVGLTSNPFSSLHKYDKSTNQEAFHNLLKSQLSSYAVYTNKNSLPISNILNNPDSIIQLFQFIQEEFALTYKEKNIFELVFLKHHTMKTIAKDFGYGYSRYTLWRSAKKIVDRINEWIVNNTPNGKALVAQHSSAFLLKKI